MAMEMESGNSKWDARDDDVEIKVKPDDGSEFESDLDKGKESKKDAPPPEVKKTFYEKHKLAIWIVIVIFVLALFAGVGYGIAKALEPSLAEFFQDHDCPIASKYDCPSGYDKEHPPLVVVALAGYDVSFSWDIYDYARSIDHLGECGSYTHDMESAFPVSRHPSLYSVVTGLYSDAHGIISDYFTVGDKESDIFNFGKIEENSEEKFYLGEPFWITAPKLGQSSASIYWPGTPKDHRNNLAATYRYPYDENVSNMKRVDRALDLIRDEKPDVTFVYLDDPDRTVEKYGPDSDEAREAAEEVDKAFGTLMGGLIKKGFHQCVNVMLVVVRGYANVTCDEDDVYFMAQDSDINLLNYESTPDELVAQKRLVPKEDAKYQSPEEIVEALQCDFHNVTTFTKSTIPIRYHLTYSELENERIPETITLAEPGTVIAGTEVGYEVGDDDALCEGGADGYDVMTLDRKSFFVGYGPSFKRNYQMFPFRSIELYNLMAELMNLNHEQVAENNGTYKGLSHALNQPGSIDIEPIELNTPNSCVYDDSDDTSEGTDCECQTQDNSYFEFYRNDLYEYNRLLELSEIKIIEVLEEHAPQGLPEILDLADGVKRAHCILTQNDYITAYSLDRNSPVYTSFSVKRQDAFFKLVKIEETGCTSRQDPRLENDVELCSMYANDVSNNVTMGYLTFPGLATKDDEYMSYTVMSNIIPAYRGYVKGIYEDLMSQIVRWADEFSQINVVTGPIYDYNHDGKADTDGVLANYPREYIVSSATNGATRIPIPSHFFFVLSKCRKEDDGVPIEIVECQPEDIDPLTIILPNRDDIGTCMGPMEYFGLHLATLKDVESLTRLNFFPDLLSQDGGDNQAANANVLRQRVEVHEIW